jgi:BirA family biotin operon repressor/biotin-[acetyl-CoA-carboxylase] ligase
LVEVDEGRNERLKECISSIHFEILTKLEPHCLFSVDSTQDYLIHTLHSRLEGQFVTSKAQTKGRGREGRIWISDEGGLYLSITLVPSDAKVIDKIARIAGDSVMRTLQLDLDLDGCSFKPPNDVIYKNKKIAGVLVDAEVKGDNSIAYVGIGVDLNNGEEWDTAIRKIATSYWLETGTEADIDIFLIQLLSKLDQAYYKLTKLA